MWTYIVVLNIDLSDRYTLPKETCAVHLICKEIEHMTAFSIPMYSTYHFTVIEYNNDWSTLKPEDEDSLIEMLEVLACQTWVAFFSPINLFLSRSISLWDMRTQLRRHSWQIHPMEFHEHHFYFLHKWFAFFLAPLRTFLSNICSELFPHLDCSHAFCRTSTERDHSLLFTRKVVAWVASRPHSTFTEEPTCS